MEKPVIATSTGPPSVKLKAILSMVARQGPLGPTFSKTGFARTGAMTKDFFDELEPFNA
jgi:hypothetical protein